jgi:hypothetical protein
LGDEISHLKEWAALAQGIAPEAGSEDGILRAVLRQDAQARDAAMALPFETEPASYTRMLEKIADKVTPK